MDEKHAKQINKEINDKQLSLINTIQRKTIETQEENIEEMKSLQGRMLDIMEKIKDEVDGLTAVIKDMKPRIEALEKKEAQRAKLRVVK